MSISNRQLVKIAIGGVILLVIIFFIFRKKEPDVTPPSSSDVIKSAIDSAMVPLQIRNDSLLRENDSLTRLINYAYQRNKELSYLIKKEHDARFTLKKQYDEKINAVDKFTPADIDSFITDRYLNKQRRK